MAILIPGLNLPKGCGDCLLTIEDHVRDYWCAVNQNLSVDGFEHTRHPKCPLVEVTIGIDLGKESE